MDKALEKVRLTMRLASSDDQATRSAAVHSLIWGFRVLTRWAELGGNENFRKAIPGAGEVRAVTRRALEQGLEPEVETLVREMLNRSP
jgi:hypothetical protein